MIAIANGTPALPMPVSTPRTSRPAKIVAPISKSESVAKLLARPKGATVTEVSSATGWQAHSVRAYLSGLRKKGRALLRELRKDGTSTYRLVAAVASPLAGFAVDDGPASQPDTGTDPVTAKFEA